MSKGNFIRRMLASIWRGLNGLRKVLHLVLLLFIFLVFFGAMSGTPPLMPKKAALFIQPSGVLVEQLEGDPFDRALAELVGDTQPQTLVQDIVDALEFARTDDRIAVVHLELSALAAGGLNKLQRVAEAIDAFEESGKPVVASAEFLLAQQGYYLAAHADELYLHPQGMVMLQGYGAYRNYFKDALDLLRIDWNVFKVGTHKSFAEPYTRMDMSPEDRESRSRLINQFWSTYQQDVVTARGLPEGAIDGYAQNMVERVASANGDTAVAARDTGLVDDLLSRSALRDRIKEYAGADSEDETLYSAVSMRDYLGQMRLLHKPKKKTENIAIVVAAGEILDGAQPPGTVGGDSAAALLRRALTDESVKAVVLRVDSPGGSVFASEVIANEVEALQEAGKPVVASMSSVAASGGYWISAGADRVVASPMTVTGSIGVIGMLPTFRRSLAAVGVATDGVSTTPWSATRLDRDLPEQARQLIQMGVENTYDDFVSGVAEQRGMDKQAVDSIGQGQVWTGAEALQNGLVDQLGDLDDAVAVAADLVGLEEGGYGRKTIGPELSPTEQMIVDLLAVAKTAGIDPASLVRDPAPVAVFANQLQKMLAGVTKFNDPRGIYAHCFCEID